MVDWGRSADQGCVVLASGGRDEQLDSAVDVAGSQHRLRGLLDAVVTIAANLSLDVTLQRIVEAARALVDAEYGALAIFGEKGHLADFVVARLDAEECRRCHTEKALGEFAAQICDPPSPKKSAESVGEAVSNAHGPNV